MNPPAEVRVSSWARVDDMELSRFGVTAEDVGVYFSRPRTGAHPLVFLLALAVGC